MVFSAGLQYDEMSLAHGVQTVRHGRTGPVSHLLGGVTLTGCFFLSRRSSKAKPDSCHGIALERCRILCTSYFTPHPSHFTSPPVFRHSVKLSSVLSPFTLHPSHFMSLPVSHCLAWVSVWRSSHRFPAKRLILAGTAPSIYRDRRHTHQAVRN